METMFHCAALTTLDYFIVCITIKSRKRAGDISGRADTGIWHGIFRKYVLYVLRNNFSFLFLPLNGQVTQRFLFLTLRLERDLT